MYSVREHVGSVELGVFFISGNAEHFVPHVNASTVHGTATGKNYFINIILHWVSLYSNSQAVLTTLLWLIGQSFLQMLIEFNI